MAPFLTLLALIALQLALLYLATGHLNRAAYERLGKRLYLAFMFPGVVVHELSHLVGCWLSRTKVHEVKLFAPKEEGRGRLVLGYVRHDMPSNPVAAGMIGAAPFFGGAAVLWAVFILAFPSHGPVFRVALPASGNLYGIARSLLEAVKGYWQFVVAVANAPWNSWRPYLALYMAVAVAAHVAPSRDDFRFATEGILAVFALMVVAFFALTRSGIVSEAAFIAAVAPKLAAVAALLGYGLAGVTIGALFFMGLDILALPFRGGGKPRRRR